MIHANSERSENKKATHVSRAKGSRKKRKGVDGKEQKKGLAGN
jgi:hypothetical protein